VFHKLPDLDDETADKIGLTREQRTYVRGADAGKEDLGYSQALVRVEEHGTSPLHVVADEFEKRIIDYEPDDRAFIQQAISNTPDDLLKFEEVVEHEARANALTNRYGLSRSTAERLLNDGLSGRALLENLLLGKQNSQPTVADGGATDAGADRGEERSQ
jgi:hypothetical protein